VNVLFTDWSKEKLTCARLDLETLTEHPQLPADKSRELCGGALMLSGSEVAVPHGGYLEGAIESSLTAVERALSK